MMKIYIFFLIILFSLITIFPSFGNDSTDHKKVRFTGILLPMRTPENGFLVQGGLLSLFKTQFNDSLLRKSNIYLFAMYSQYKQYRYSVGGEVFTPKETFYIYNWWYYSYQPELYFGLTTNSIDLDPEWINYKIIHFETDILNQFKKKNFIGLCLDFENINHVNYLKSGIFELDKKKGYNGYISGGIGVKYRYDSRDMLMWTCNGLFIEPFFKLYSFLSKQNSIFYITGADIRYYKSIKKNKSFVLGNQFYIRYASVNTPFRYLPFDQARAYHPNQYRNNTALIIRSEARKKLFRFIYFAAFAELSETLNSISNVFSNPIRYSIGPGIRFKILKNDQLFLTFDYGIGKKSTNYYISFNSAF